MCVHTFFFFSSRRRHTRFDCDWSSDVCSSDLIALEPLKGFAAVPGHGIRATVKGQPVRVGNLRLMEVDGLGVAGLETETARLAEAGLTPMFVAVGGTVVGDRKSVV